jgi:small subunit ribosomal protein S3
MGRKVNPMGFRIGIIRDWKSNWYDEQHYGENILEDYNLRKAIRKKYPEAGISLIEIERQANKVGVIVHTARPGIVIGRGGSRVEEMRQYLESQLGGKKVQLDVREIRQPELDALLVARSVADQMERRVAYRRAMKQSMFRTVQAGAKGMRIICSGRLGGVEIARRQMMHQGRVPLQTLRADIDYGFTEAHTTLGRIGVKVWIYRGDIFPEAVAIAEAPAIAETTIPDRPAVKPEAKTETAPVVEPGTAPKKPRTRRKPASEGTLTETSAESAVEETSITEIKSEKKTEETAGPATKTRKSRAASTSIVEVAEGSATTAAAEKTVKPKVQRTRAASKKTSDSEPGETAS